MRRQFNAEVCVSGRNERIIRIDRRGHTNEGHPCNRRDFINDSHPYIRRGFINDSRPYNGRGFVNDLRPYNRRGFVNDSRPYAVKGAMNDPHPHNGAYKHVNTNANFISNEGMNNFHATSSGETFLPAPNCFFSARPSNFRQNGPVNCSSSQNNFLQPLRSCNYPKNYDIPVNNYRQPVVRRTNFQIPDYHYFETIAHDVRHSRTGQMHQNGFYDSGIQDRCANRSDVLSHGSHSLCDAVRGFPRDANRPTNKTQTITNPNIESNIHFNSGALVITPPPINVGRLLSQLSSYGLTSASKPQTCNPPPRQKKLPSMTDFSVEKLKVKHTILVDQIYAGIKCSTCGLMFPPIRGKDKKAGEEAKSRYRNHLQKHFDDKIRKDNAKTRPPFKSPDEWLSFKCVNDVSTPLEDEANAGEGCSTQKPSEGTFDKPPFRKLNSGSVAKDRMENPICFLCNEGFDEAWDDDREGWYWSDSKIQGNTMFHSACFSDFQSQGFK